MTFDAAKERELRILDRMTRCVHFNGIQNEACKAGVNYRAMVGGEDLGWATRIPCNGRTTGIRACCGELRLTTREEAEAAIARADASLERLRTCMTAIRAKHGKARGLRGAMPCPTGCGGTLQYSIAGVNGHVWGQCSTPGCARWMQ